MYINISDKIVNGVELYPIQEIFSNIGKIM